MIINVINDRIEKSDCKHFGSMVVEGVQGGGRDLRTFMTGFWPGREKIVLPIGTILSHIAGDKTFHLLACSPYEENEKTKIPSLLEECLNALEIPEGETIALQVSDWHPSKKTDEIVYNLYEILGAIARSKVSAVVYRH